MTVVVLMSSYNGEKYIKQQIESILNQTKTYETSDGYTGYFDLKLFVRDDGSNDRTLDYLEKYRENGKLEYYSGDNKGSSKSFFDTMWKAPKADYYAFADQDDYWLDSKLSRAISILEREDPCKPKLYGSNAKLVDKDLNDMGIFFYPKKFDPEFKLVSCSCGMLGCTMVFNNILMELIRSHSKPDNAIMHDYYVTLLCCALNGTVIYDNFAKILYRQHGKNVCGASSSVLKKIKSHIYHIMLDYKNSIFDQAQEIAEKFSDILPENNKKWLFKVGSCKKSLSKRIMLAFSTEYHFYSIRRAIPMRLRILIGKI